MRLAAALGLLLLWGAGCAGERHRLSLGWVSAAELKDRRAVFADEPAVILERNDEVLIGLTGRLDPYVQFGRHELIALQQESGFSLAEVKIPFRATDEFLELRARVKRPGQPWEELDAPGYISDVDEAGAQDLNARFFRFPGIEVGALLEYYYVIGANRMIWYSEHESVGQFPVRRYSLRLEADNPLQLSAHSYNPVKELSARPFGEESKVLELEFRDIPPRPPEDFAPDWTFSEPRWTWRITDVRIDQLRIRGLREWPDLLGPGGGGAGLAPELYQGYAAPLELGDCAAVRCKVERVLAFAATHARNKGGPPLQPMRPLKTVLETNSATGGERAILVRRLLEDLGVTAKLALAARHWSTQVDPNVPSYSQFNELLVHLPPQEGLQAGAWLLPRCDYCGFNEVPQEVRGVRALVFGLHSSRDEVVAEWKTTSDALPALATQTTLHHQARIDADGLLTDTFRTTLEGKAAEEEHLSAAHQTQDDRFREQAAEVAERSALGELLEVTPTRCEPQRGRCELQTRFAIPVYATRESAQRWLVPLNALSATFQSTLAVSQAKRRSDLYFEEETRTQEVFELEVPAGFVLESPPPPERTIGPLVEAEVKVEPTAQGARVTRTLRQSIGGVPVVQYESARRPFRAFQEVRGLVLSFVKKG